jgi:hypothetical protein
MLGRKLVWRTMTVKIYSFWNRLLGIMLLILAFLFCFHIKKYFNMTNSDTYEYIIGEIAPIAGKIVRTATFRQRFFKNDFSDYFGHLVHVTAAFFRHLEVFLELIREMKVEHWLGVFCHFPQLGLQFFLCSGGTLPFHPDFSGRNSLGLPHGDQGNGVGNMNFTTFRANIAIYSGFGPFSLFYIHVGFLYLEYTLFCRFLQLSPAGVNLFGNWAFSSSFVAGAAAIPVPRLRAPKNTRGGYTVRPYPVIVRRG